MLAEVAADLKNGLEKEPKDSDLNKLFPDIAEIRLDKLFPDLKVPDGGVKPKWLEARQARP